MSLCSAKQLASSLHGLSTAELLLSSSCGGGTFRWSDLKHMAGPQTCFLLEPLFSTCRIGRFNRIFFSLCFIYLFTLLALWNYG